MDSKNKIIIIDLWQTLADSTFKPSDLFDNLFELNNTIIKSDFLRMLFKSELYLKDISLEKGLKSFLLDLGVYNKENLGTTISLWKEMVKKSSLINGSEAMLTALKNRGYKLCLLTNIDKYGFENFPFKSLLNIFDYQFLSYKNGYIKPGIRCWEVIKDHYKTDYKSMIMVGDSIENDTAPSEYLGLSTILIDINKKDKVYDEVYDKLINN
mgnify:CR=1 FL=1